MFKGSKVQGCNAASRDWVFEALFFPIFCSLFHAKAQRKARRKAKVEGIRFNPNCIAGNMHIFDFELSKADMKTLDALDKDKRFGVDLADFDF